MVYAQGSIVLVENPYADGLRPVMIVSNADRPYQGKQYTVAIVTSRERDEAIRLDSDDFSEGSLNVLPSFVNPWSLHEFEATEINRRVAQASNEVIHAVAEEIVQHTEPES